MNITIKNKEYNLKYTLRALFIFEQITKHNFSIETLFEQYTFYYSILLANNKDIAITFEEFIDMCDEDSTIAKTFQEFLNEEANKRNQFEKVESEDSEKKDI